MKLTSLLLSVGVALSLALLPSTPATELEFTTPIDAISFTLQNNQHTQIREYTTQGWQEWKFLEIEKEFDPTLQESNMIVFNEKVQKIQVRSAQGIVEPHPIILDGTTPSYEVAVTVPVSSPKILLRRQWGANDDYLVQGSNTNRSDEPSGDAPDVAKSARELECETWQLNYPNDFAVAGTNNTDDYGRTLRWTQRYSPKVHTLVVHHTASANSSNTRSGYETMQALYAYHANNRGWGDIGYNYVIDANGQIYEGRAGGKGVVGGHTYCNNVGTLGIALMGNFDIEAPTQAQSQSLQWLIDYLAKEYSIDLNRNVTYHGMIRNPILGHKDLVSTACPGSILYPALSQIRSNVQRGNVTARVNYAVTRTPQLRSLFRISGTSNSPHEMAFLGSSKILARPSGFVNVQLQVKVGSSGLTPRQKIAEIDRSSSTIGIWQLNSAGNEVRALNSLVSFGLYSPGETITMPLRLQVPDQAGSYVLRIGTALLRIDAEGRRSRVSQLPSQPTETVPVSQRARSVQVIERSSGPITFRPIIRRSLTRSSTSSTATAARTTTSSLGPNIRIKLSHSAPVMRISSSSAGMKVNGAQAYNMVQIEQSGESCIVKQGATQIAQGSIVRFVPLGDSLTISSWEQTFNEFRGALECRVEDGQLILINELPIEEYLWGLSEEPDTEPYQKQRAFAIAARSYAAHYLDERYRKFPGKSYDGSDSPAVFQKYSGKKFESVHPRWVEAVKSTALQVVMYNGQIVKTPYFSSDDGRTRSPAERGWNSFLFAEIFSSKPDPWCEGETLRGHGVGMSGCGAEGQANEGKTAEAILRYYYPGTSLESI